MNVEVPILAVGAVIWLGRSGPGEVVLNLSSAARAFGFPAVLRCEARFASLDELRDLRRSWSSLSRTLWRKVPPRISEVDMTALGRCHPGIMISVDKTDYFHVEN